MRPSQVLGLETEWGAFQLDELCATVGTVVEGNLMNGKEPFAGLSAQKTEGMRSGQKFRSPKHLVKRKMKIPESGIW